MRVSTLQMHNTMSSSMQKATGDVNKTMMQLATGKRILNPSDDPFAAMQLMGMSDDLSKLETWAGNINTATAALSNQETALSDMHNNLNRARDLILSAGNGSMGPDELDAIATELEQVLESIAGLGNTKSSSGEHIFGGTAGQDAAIYKDEDGNWQFGGSTNVRELQISDSQKIKLGVTADELFFNSDPDFFTGMEKFIDVLRSGDSDALEGAIADALNVIDSTLDGVNKSLTTVGSQLNSLDAAADTNEDRQLTNKALQGSLEDLDYVEAVTRLSVEQTILAASQQGYAKINQMSLFNYI